METSQESLQRAVDLIKNIGVKKETRVTEEEMARKLDLSEKQLYAYLNGETPTPADLPSRLKSAYNLRTYIVESTQTHRVRDPRPAKDEQARLKNNRSSFRTTLSFIKKIGQEKGMIITDEELAIHAGISGGQLDAYSRGEERVPDDLSSVLLAAYSDLIKNVGKESSRESLKHTVVLIRNRGLSLGMNITVKEMAGKIETPEDVLYGCLNDQADMPQDDLAYRLRLAYTDLLQNLKQVEIKEDIHTIKFRGG